MAFESDFTDPDGLPVDSVLRVSKLTMDPPYWDIAPRARGPDDHAASSTLLTCEARCSSTNGPAWLTTQPVTSVAGVYLARLQTAMAMIVLTNESWRAWWIWRPSDCCTVQCFAVLLIVMW